jgi:hypothetical protein
VIFRNRATLPCGPTAHIDFFPLDWTVL